MYRFFGVIAFLIIGTILGLQNICWGIHEVSIYTTWYFALILTCGIVGMTTSKVRKGMFWGVLLWVFALAVYETTLGILQWSRWHYPFDMKSLVEGFVLILVVGVPVSWISSWLSVKNKAIYFGATVMSTAGVLVLSKTLLSLYVSGVFGRGF